MTPAEYVGKRFRARRRMSFIDGELVAGQEFTFSQRYADMGLQPDLWLQHGVAELVTAVTWEPEPVAVEPVAVEPEPDPTPARRRGRRHGAATDLDGLSMETDVTDTPEPWAPEGGD